MITSYYRPGLSLIHHQGFGFCADLGAPDMLALLAPVAERHGLGLETVVGERIA